MATKDDFRHALEDLQEQVDNAKTIPLTKMLAVDDNVIRGLIKALHDNLPDAMRECESIIRNQDVILEEANQEKTKAAGLTAKARQEWENTQARIKQAENMLNAQAKQFLDTAHANAAQQESQIIAEANNQANTIIAQAKTQAESIIADAQAEAARLVSHEEIMVQAAREAAGLRESTQNEMEKLYDDVHQELNEILVCMDRVFSEEVSKVRTTRQQLDSTY